MLRHAKRDRWLVQLPRQLGGTKNSFELIAQIHVHGGSASLLKALKVPLAFAGWYLLSIYYSIMNKQVLKVWNFPCTFSVTQLAVGSLWILLLWSPLPLPARKAPISLRSPPRLSRGDFGKLYSVAIWLALGHLMSTIAPAYGTVAFTNVVKTAEPIFTCIFAALFFGQTFSLPVYLTLVPVIAGVLLATASEVSFSTASLVSGLLSNVCFALRATTAKRVMGEPIGENLTAQNLYGVLTLQALGTLLPFALFVEGGQIVTGTITTVKAVGLFAFAKMLLLTGLSHYMYNECAFLALSSVHPVTHAVANTVKRIAVIVLSVLYFRDPLTLTGAAGSAVAIIGVLLYSLAKAQWAASQAGIKAQ